VRIPAQAGGRGEAHGGPEAPAEPERGHHRPGPSQGSGGEPHHGLQLAQADAGTGL